MNIKSVEQIKQAVIDTNYYEFTKNPLEAIFILEDGTMIDGQFDWGVRGTDHRMIEGIVEGSRYDGEKFWNHVHDHNIIRLIPETKIALIKSSQIVNDIQNHIIKSIGFDIEEY